MIAASRPSWQTELARAYRDPLALLRDLELPLPLDGKMSESDACSRYPMRVPRPFAARMRKGDPNDPLLRQVLPTQEEGIKVNDYVEDPVGDCAARCQPGLLEKYRGRVLLLTTNACAINCRYCFRRHLRQQTCTPPIRDFGPALAYVKSQPKVNEIILSGGDPLCLSDEKLARLTDRLAEITHVKRLRIHTRLPVVLPERVCDGLLSWLSAQPWPVVVVLHINHGNEIDATVVSALARLRAAQATLLNQSVLLKGINDSVSALAQLSEALFAAGVLPYYLHLLDRVQGASHFEVAEPHAQSLLHGLRRELPGYLVPKLVREAPGSPYKRPV